MIKIKALNESSSSCEEEPGESEKTLITREAREELLKSLYFDALRLIDSDKNRAKEELIGLLVHLNKSPKDASSNTISHLKFLTLKNLGFLCDDNLEYFLDALCIEDNDVSLWIEAGRRAFKNYYNLPLARYCFEMAHKLSDKNWVVLDTLINIYFILNDYDNCFISCLKALQVDQYYMKAQILLKEILIRFPPLHKKLPANLKWLINWKPTKSAQETILENLDSLKQTRKRKLSEDKETSKCKRKQYNLNLNSQTMSLLVLGMQIKKLHQHIEKDTGSLATLVKIKFDSEQDDSLNTDKNGGVNGLNDENMEKEKPKMVNRQQFPFEFIDKRRSTRVQRIQKSGDLSTINSDEVFERVYKLIPSSILSREYQVKTTESEMSKCKEQGDDNLVIVSNFLNHQSVHKNHTRRISQLIDDYLFLVSSKCLDIRIPSFFIDFYRIHRSMNELPHPLAIRIDETISRAELYLILCALECEYIAKEAAFLKNILPYLEKSLDKEDYDNFFLRFLVVIGSKELNKDVLKEASDYMKTNNIQSVCASNKVTHTIDSIQAMTKSLVEDSLNSLLSQQKHEELIEILISKSDLSFSEQTILSKALEESHDLQKSVDIITRNTNPSDELLRTLHGILKRDSNLILYNSLVMRLLKLGTEKFNIEAWICLLVILINQVDKSFKEKDLVEVITLLHQYLGKKGFCTGSNGRFLTTALEYLTTQCFSANDDLILQCFSCLFDYPQRKLFSSHLLPHRNASVVPLTWENVELVYNYFAPEKIPEFDSLKRGSIDSETEVLFARIYPLIPDHLCPRKEADMIEQYLTSGKEIAQEFTTKVHPVTKNLYYFLADYYFKNKEFQKARDFYELDLALNRKRFDSWAACALSISHLIEQILTRSDESKATSDKICQLSESAFRCYSEALKIEPDNSKIWIEHGNLAYNVGSYFSRLSKSIRLEGEENATRCKELGLIHKNMLIRARNSFESANKTEHEEERWLHYYFLGKIEEKMGSLRALRYYNLADLHLSMNGATYPRRIGYHNPSRLSIESLEIHYRIHACIMKYLQRNPNSSRKILNLIRIHLLRALRSPFGKQIQYSSPTMPDHDYLLIQESSSSHKRAQVTADIREVMDDLLALVEDDIIAQDVCRLNTIIQEMSNQAMHRCLQRFPNHYKSLYRLANHYHNMSDFIAARIVLLGRFTAFSSGSKSKLKKIASVTEAASNDIKCDIKNELFQGLFTEQKNNNLFNGIWRIPVDDIDRPGSFSAHMSRSTLLLIKILSALADVHTLSSIALQLNRTPDAQKRYLRDADRLRLGHEAVCRCFVILRNKISDALQQQSSLEEVGDEIKKITEKLMKCNSYYKETNSFLKECEKLLKELNE